MFPVMCSWFPSNKDTVLLGILNGIKYCLL